MSTKLFARKILIATVLIGFFSFLIIGVSGQKNSKTTNQPISDTVPKIKKDKTVRDLDDELNDFDQLDMQKMKKELESAMKELDMAKIKLETEKAMRDVDMEKMKIDLQNSLSKINTDKINEQMKQAMKEIDAVKLDKQIKESMDKIQWDKLNAQLDEVKKIDMTKMQDQMKEVEEHLKKMGPEIEKQMEKAKLDMEKAKKEMKDYEDFTDGLQSDGLINKKNDYNIEEKNSQLIINGKTQSTQVYNKYRSFLESHKGLKIQKSDGDYNIHRGNDHD